MYSLGLAYYLTFQGQFLDSQDMDRYLAVQPAGKDAVRRFETLVEMPLGQFEARWREAMVALRVRRE